MVSETDRSVSQPLASRYLAYAEPKSCMNSLASSPPSPGLISMIIVISFRRLFIKSTTHRQSRKRDLQSAARIEENHKYICCDEKIFRVASTGSINNGHFDHDHTTCENGSC